MQQIQHQLKSSSDLERNPAGASSHSMLHRLKLINIRLVLAIVPTLRAQHASFMTLASYVASLDSDLKALRDEYRAIWREKTSSVQDPFARNASGRGLEKGLNEIELR